MKKPILEFWVFYNLILHTTNIYCEIKLETKWKSKSMRVHICRPSFLPCSHFLTMTSFVVPNKVEAAAKKDNAPYKRKIEKRKLKIIMIIILILIPFF